MVQEDSSVSVNTGFQEAADVLAKHGLFQEYSDFADTYPGVSVNSTLMTCVDDNIFSPVLACNFIDYCVSSGICLQNIREDMLQQALGFYNVTVAKHLIKIGMDLHVEHLFMSFKLYPEQVSINFLKFLLDYNLNIRDLNKENFHIIVTNLCSMGRKDTIQFLYELGCDFSDYQAPLHGFLSELVVLEGVGIDFSTYEWSQIFYNYFEQHSMSRPFSIAEFTERVLSMNFNIEPIKDLLVKFISFSAGFWRDIGLSRETKVSSIKYYSMDHTSNFAIATYQVFQKQTNTLVRLTVFDSGTIDALKRYGLELDDYHVVSCREYVNEIPVDIFCDFRPEERIILVRD